MRRIVMVIDDSRVIRQQVCQILSSAGFDVVTAVDGLDALEKLEAGPISLIFCDLNMPRMSGLGFLRALGNRAVTISVVMLTSDGQQSLIERAKANGAKGWIVKPFRPESLIAVARRLIAASPAEPAPSPR